MNKPYLFCLILVFCSNVTFSQEILRLWLDKIPNHRESDEKETQNNDNILWIENVQEPSLEIYLPTKQNATGKAVIICPGGGYQGLAYDWEGSDIAKWFNSKGIAAFVLKYRLPKSKSVLVGHEAPLQDAKRAIRLVRNNADTWNIKKDQIGIMGFSAGGHLASTLGTHYKNNSNSNSNSNALDTLSARPDYMILVYPVITMTDEYTHAGSRNNLLGNEPNPQLEGYYSNELHINNETPPTFLLHASDDEAVPVMNSLLFYDGLQKAGVYTEMHIYPNGGHGFSLAIGRGHLQTWTDRLYEWILSLN